jgi:hypothetical protein
MPKNVSLAIPPPFKRTSSEATEKGKEEEDAVTQPEMAMVNKMT